MAGTVQLLLLFYLLCLAAIWDMKKRMIPDTICILTAMLTLISFDPMKLVGILAAMPLFFAGITIGGIGGGDIKLTGAIGLVLGFQKTLTGLILSLLLLIIFHGCRKLWHEIQTFTRKRKSEQNRNQNREQAYPFVPFLFFGMTASMFC